MIARRDVSTPNRRVPRRLRGQRLEQGDHRLHLLDERPLAEVAQHAQRGDGFFEQRVERDADAPACHYVDALAIGRHHRIALVERDACDLLKARTVARQRIAPVQAEEDRLVEACRSVDPLAVEACEGAFARCCRLRACAERRKQESVDALPIRGA